MGDGIRCPDSPQELGLKPATWWPTQQESVQLILDAFLSGKKYVIAAIPTGGGKTLIAAAVQKLLSRASGMGARSLVCTHTIQLQHQYRETLPEAAVVTGRSNHLCELAPDNPAHFGYEGDHRLTAEDAPCINGGSCPEDKKHINGCGYYAQLGRAIAAPMVVMNYAYACRILQQPFMGKDSSGQPLPNPFRRNLLVADECHLTEQAVTQAAGIKLWAGPMQKLALALPSFHTRLKVVEGGPRSQKEVWYENVRVWMDWATESLIVVDPALKRARAEEKSAILTRNPVTAKHAIFRRKSLEALHGALKQLEALEDPAQWIVRRDFAADGKRLISVTAQPLFGFSVANEYLFKHFEHVLLMSATPGDPQMSRMMLGIPEEDCQYIERPSTFPRTNRPVFFWDVAKLNYKSTDEEWERIAKAIGWVATRPEHMKRKGIVHSGSKRNADRLVQLLNHYLGGGRAFSHGDGHDHTREEALAEFQDSPLPRILVTASFTTGVDLPYVIGWQVIAKVPFGSLGDEITARRRAYKLSNEFPFGQRAYEAECANTVVQAAGRVVRTPQDTGPTYILDGNWQQLKSRAWFPQFFLDAYQKFVLES